MNWDDLRIFLTVARVGQIGRAGPLLGIDATTVGRRVRRLERALGQRLLEQTRDGQRLTEAGSRLLAQAETIERASATIGSAGDELGGLLRVSASEGFGTWFVAHHLRAFGAANPAIKVDLVATSGFLSPTKRETDVAILLARPRRGPLVTRKLTDYGLRLFAARSYLAGAPPIRWRADLHAHRLIGYIPDLIFAPELDYLEEVAPGLEPAFRSSSINAQYRLTAAGAGVAVLPCFIGDTDPALVRVLPEVALQRAFWLTTHEDTRGVPRIRRFVDWLTETTAAQRERLLG